jgi:hypothetical protein
MHDLKEMRPHWKLKEEALHCTHILLPPAKQFTLKEGCLKYQALIRFSVFFKCNKKANLNK